MAVPVRVPRLGSDEAEARVAEWYQPDGSAVRRGQPVYRLETDFAAVEVEAEEDGMLRHQARAGAMVLPGNVVAFITSEGETAPTPTEAPGPGASQHTAAKAPGGKPAEKPPAPPPPPPLVSSRSRGRARALAAATATPVAKSAGTSPAPPASALRAAAEKVSALAADPVEESEWKPAPEPEDEPDARPASVLLFPRIPNEGRQPGPAGAADNSDPFDPSGDYATPTRARVSAWDLVPGESDFNPEWITEREEPPGDAPEEQARSRFQASNIRSLALGKKAKPSGKQPSRAPEKGAGARGEEVAVPSAEVSAPAAAARATPPPEPSDVTFEERREEQAPGPALSLRVSLDMGEAVKMRDQLTREWWGSNVRPTNEDIVLRAIARVLEESAAFRRSSDLVGMRVLSGGPRAVHVVSDTARRPFREAVAGLAALRATPGTEMPCICTLTSFAEYDLDAGVPALPAGQSLAIAMGAVRDVPRYRGDHPYRAMEMSLTMSYDSDAIPDGAAAKLLARIRELVEAPYALLAH